MDPRETLAVGDIASTTLQGLVPARAYRTPERLRAVRGSQGVLKAPDADAEQVDQILFGEDFLVLDRQGGFVFGQAERDGYVGWTLADGLEPARGEPTHTVSALRTLAFSAQAIKSRPWGYLSRNALVRVIEADERVARVEGAGWVPLKHLRPIGAVTEDWVAAALDWVGAPYLWGGRDGFGVDCSGLVQQALAAAGIAAPRDSDLQRARLGRPAETPAHGDLAFWKGHVGVCLEGERLLHANAHHMAVVVEPWAEAVARMGSPEAIRRL
jgi:NlpC/P60 family/Bacterial dipeptidyl-peptidase Sh3 domain